MKANFKNGFFDLPDASWKHCLTLHLKLEKEIVIFEKKILKIEIFFKSGF